MKKIFYEVLNNGAIVKYQEDKPDYYLNKTITFRNEDDSWGLDENIPFTGGCRIWLVPENIQERIRGGNFFHSLDDAIAKSKVLWDEFFAPNALWEVIEVFDNVELKVISEPMPKVEAKKVLASYTNSQYTKYSIRVAKNQ